MTTPNERSDENVEALVDWLNAAYTQQPEQVLRRLAIAAGLVVDEDV